ncbi:MAG: hypothetical protein ABIP21_11605 [Acidimicrobiia bacterium]
MNDDELCSILHREADRIEEGPDSWSRLESRLNAAPVRSAPRSFAFGALTMVVVVALVVGVVWIGRDDRRAQRPVAKRSVPAPSRIVAVTRHDDLVVLNSRSGAVIRTLARDVVTGFRGSPSLSVTSDGATLYYTDAIPKDDGPGCPGAPNVVMRIPIAGGASTEVRRGRNVAISPDGTTLASADDWGICADGAGVLTLSSSGGNPVELRTEGLANELVLERLSWSPDSRFLSFQWLKTTAGGYLLDTRTARSVNDAVCICTSRDAPELFGYLGTTGDFLGQRRLVRTNLTEKIWRSPTKVLALGHDGSIHRTLFSVRGVIEDLRSDRSGEHVLATVSGGGRKFGLYRWSKGESKPTMIRDGIVAAAWIPDDPRLIPRSIIASGLDRRTARVGDGVKFRIPTGDSRIEVRMVPGPLTFERRTGAGWQGVQSLEPFTTAFASRPNSVIHTLTIPQVPGGRYRVCASVIIRQSGTRQVGKTCRSMVVRR